MIRFRLTFPIDWISLSLPGVEFTSPTVIVSHAFSLNNQSFQLDLFTLERQDSP